MRLVVGPITFYNLTLKQNNNLRLGLFNFGMQNKPAPELTAPSLVAGAYGARPCASKLITKYC
jgi:hypothetical protein